MFYDKRMSVKLQAGGCFFIFERKQRNYRAMQHFRRDDAARCTALGIKF